MARTVAITLEDAVLARVEAHARQRGQTLEELVNARLRELGEDYVSAPLPAGACLMDLVMHGQGGRDVAARFLRDARWSEYEQPLPVHLYAWLRRMPGLVVDGGANTGFYTLLAAAAHPQNLVLAFEPNPAVRQLLADNVAANRVAERVEISEAALHDEIGTAPLFVPPDEFGVVETSASLEGRFKKRHAQVLTVPTTTVDAALAGRAVSVIKLDLAGHEARALRGAEASVAAHRPLVIVEALENADFGALSAFLERHNYMGVPLRWGEPLVALVNVVWNAHAWNHALVPAEKVPGFLRWASEEA